MVSGYVGSRLRIADYAFGTNFASLSLDDNKVHLMLENTSTGTTVYYKVNQTLDDGPSGLRVAITPECSAVPGGKSVIDFYVNAPFIEIACTGGQGNIRAQVDSRLKWEQMAMSRTDTFGAPQLWNHKYVGPGVVAPAPFPQS